MKKLMLCEGKHDTEFLKQFFEKLQVPQNKIKFFDQKERDILVDLKRAESRYIARFIQKTSPHDILVKSEAGKPKVINAFSDFIVFIFQNINNTTLMVDLDNNGLDLFLEKLRNKLIERRLNIISNIIDKNQYIVTSENSMTLNTKKK